MDSPEAVLDEKSLDRDHLALLLRVSEILGSSLDIEQILDSLMDQVIEALGATRGFVLMRDGADRTWQFRSARAADPDLLDRDDFRISRGIVDKVADLGVSILSHDAIQDVRFKKQQSISLYNLKSILCVPIVIEDVVRGVVYADNPAQTGVFGKKHKLLLESIARLAAIALEKAMLYDELKRVHLTAMEQARKELAETQAQLFQSSKMAAVGQLAAGVAHEINNPLGAIALNIGSLKNAVQEPSAVRRLEIVAGAVARVKSIVERLLRFSHPGLPEAESVNLGQVVTDTLALLEREFEKCGIGVEVCMDEGLYVRGNSGEISQALMNILLNARDALTGFRHRTPRDVMRPPHEPSPRVEIHGASTDGRVRLVIKDNGPGMDDLTRQRIFEPFFTTKEIGEGVGLGLAVTFQIVRRHEGEVTVESEPGQGARFVLTFPAGGLIDG